ncbi:MAG: hypothetical protein U5P10_08245 [Spirochaetia bacterium]|nr:hypothetical protein [Spirochaetia bacterium]
MWSPSQSRHSTTPAFHLVPDEEQVQIILEQVPEGSYGFKPYRKGPEVRGVPPLTVAPVVPVQDPHIAYELMGSDADWIAGNWNQRSCWYGVR